jgi:hypothetical protein
LPLALGVLLPCKREAFAASTTTGTGAGTESAPVLVESDVLAFRVFAEPSAEEIDELTVAETGVEVAVEFEVDDGVGVGVGVGVGAGVGAGGVGEPAVGVGAPEGATGASAPPGGGGAVGVVGGGVTGGINSAATASEGANTIETILKVINIRMDVPIPKV